MLALSRHAGESVIIGGTIKVQVIRIMGAKVRLGFDAPEGVHIRREELGPDPNRTESAQTDSEQVKALTDQLAAAEQHIRIVHESRAELQEQLAAARQDCLTLALRVYGEDDSTHAPETLAVMDRWRPVVESVLADGGAV